MTNTTMDKTITNMLKFTVIVLFIFFLHLRVSKLTNLFLFWANHSFEINIPLILAEFNPIIRNI